MLGCASAGPSACVPRGRGPLFKSMPVPDRAFAGVGRHLKILGQLQTIGRTGIFTQTTEHAARSIVGKRGKHFASRGVVAVPSDDDKIFRAGQGAEIAGNTKSFA